MWNEWVISDYSNNHYRLVCIVVSSIKIFKKTWIKRGKGPTETAYLYRPEFCATPCIHTNPVVGASFNVARDTAMT